MTVTFVKEVKEAANISTFYFSSSSRMDYTAGQFIELTLKHKNPDNRGIKRWFTLSSSPKDELLSITTKFAAKNGSSYKKALGRLKAGDKLEMSDPMGDFVLPKLIQTPLVFVAGGIGITPFKSMLTWLKETDENRPVKLLVGVNSEDEIVFQDIINEAKVHATFVVSEPSNAWGGETGRLSSELILGVEEPTEDTLIYISGPEPMVEHLENDLQKAGIKKHQLVLDFFPNYGEEY